MTTTTEFLCARATAEKLSDAARHVLAAARAEELHTDGNRWWDALTPSAVNIAAVSWCRGAELIEPTTPHADGPRRTFRLTPLGRQVAQIDGLDW